MKTLKDKEKRLLIAKLCGWIRPIISDGPNKGELSEDYIIGPNGETVLLRYLDGNNSASNHKLPDYLNDLNAINNALLYVNEKDKHFVEKFLPCLALIISDRKEPDYKNIGKWEFITASAKQRSEALILYGILYDEECSKCDSPLKETLKNSKEMA
jgi:hypothetical protein